MAKNITVSGLTFTPALAEVFRTARLLDAGFSAETLARVSRRSVRGVGQTITTLINYDLFTHSLHPVTGGSVYSVTPKGYGLPVF